jgi:hypothetical protein
MTVIKEERGRLNAYAIEPTMYYTEITMDHNTFAEKLNGRLAMLGFVAAVGAYALTGQIIPGLF